MLRLSRLFPLQSRRELADDDRGSLEPADFKILRTTSSYSTAASTVVSDESSSGYLASGSEVPSRRHVRVWPDDDSVECQIEKELALFPNKTVLLVHTISRGDTVSTALSSNHDWDADDESDVGWEEDPMIVEVASGFHIFQDSEISSTD